MVTFFLGKSLKSKSQLLLISAFFVCVDALQPRQPYFNHAQPSIIKQERERKDRIEEVKYVA